MGHDPDWPGLLTDYEGALEAFEAITQALTTALVDRESPAAEFPALLAAEANARDAVVLTRMRVMKAWQELAPRFSS